ncbi:uncharacterized protein [Henckelia pumila]|uniref:uncharacterized protein n=1 Tax=Henckelia pumila TaxID=405737 RepID=UPI003C6E7EDB
MDVPVVDVRFRPPEVNNSDLCEDSISLITQKFENYLKRRNKQKFGQQFKHPNFSAPENLLRVSPTREPSRPRYVVNHESNTKYFDYVQCRECKGYGHYAIECANRFHKGMTMFLSDDDSDRDQEQNDEEDHISLAALLKAKKCFQVNPLGVASSVATPSRNTSEKSVCLNTSTLGNFGDQEAVNDDITLECVQELYEELYADRIKRNNLNTALSKENYDLKSTMAKLEVILGKKNLEFCKDKGELEKVTLNLAKYNSSTSKLDFIMGKDGKVGLGLVNRVFEVGESSKPTVFVKKGSNTSSTSIVAPSFKNSPSKECVPPQMPKQ